MKIENAQTFGEVVKQYRKRQRISQSQLAAIARTGLRFISDLENGKPTVQLDKALNVAFLLGITLEAPDVCLRGVRSTREPSVQRQVPYPNSSPAIYDRVADGEPQ